METYERIKKEKPRYHTVIMKNVHFLLRGNWIAVYITSIKIIDYILYIQRSERNIIHNYIKGRL